MEVLIAKYILQYCKSLFYPALYPAHNLTQIDPPAIREVHDKNFMDDF